MTRKWAMLNPTLWGGLSIGMVAITVAAYSIGSYQLAEQCYYLVHDFAEPRVANPEFVGDIGSVPLSLVPFGPSCTWSYEGQSAVLYPASTSIISTFAVVTVALIAITVLIGVFRGMRTRRMRTR